MTENTDAENKAKLTVSQVYSLYVHARDRISKHFIESIEARKFGGQGQEVLVDFTKLHLRNLKAHKCDEYVVLGFIEKDTMRTRGYIVPNCKS